jgi:hypothetical protein
MIRASLIYMGVTFLLALVDAIRINIARRKGQSNIAHKVSTELAAIFGVVVAATGIWGDKKFGLDWIYRLLIVQVALVFIRLIFYDPLLNVLRRLPLDYESGTTSSWIDRHVHFSFWQKRAIGVAAWVIIVLVYYKIF